MQGQADRSHSRRAALLCAPVEPAGGLESSHPVDVIWNPNAGGRELNQTMLEQFQTLAGFRVHYTESENDAVRQTDLLLGSGAQSIAACGGDGVINVVADVILRSGRSDVRFIVLPMGTGNDYARSLGLPLSAVEAASFAHTGEVRPLDAFHLEGPHTSRFGVNMLAAGNTGKYTQLLTDDLKQQWGPFCFLRGAIDVLQNLEVYPLRLRFDDGPWQEFEVLNLFVANGRCAGAGLPVASEARLDDGFLDVVVVLEGTGIQLADLALQYVLADHREHELILCRRVRTVEFAAAQPLAWAVDGQEFTETRLKVAVAPQRLNVVVGPTAPAVSGEDARVNPS